MPQGSKHGKGQRRCRRCGSHQGIIRRYGINICRRCFYEIADDIGFSRYS
jgi:ribosomal protein S14